MSLRVAVLVFTLLNPGQQGPINPFVSSENLGPLPFNVDDFSGRVRQIALSIGLPDPTGTAPDISVGFVHSDDFASQLDNLTMTTNNMIAPVADMADSVDTLVTLSPDLSSGLSSPTGIDPIGAGVATVHNLVDPMADQVAAPFAYAKGGVILLKDLGDAFPSFVPLYGLIFTMWLGIVWMVFVHLLVTLGDVVGGVTKFVTNVVAFAKMLLPFI